MSAPVTTPRSGEPIVLAMLRKGRGLDYIARASGWPEADLRDLADEHEIAVVPVDPAPAARPAAVGTPPPAAAPGVDGLRERIDKALDHPSKRVQAAARRVEAALDRLTDTIDADNERNAEKRARATEKQAARAEVDRLAAQLAEAKARLRGNRRPREPRPARTAASGEFTCRKGCGRTSPNAQGRAAHERHCAGASA